MKHELLTDEELAQLVEERAEGDGWIVVIGNQSKSFQEFCMLIENRFYPPNTPKNEGFEIILPQPIVFLRKKELSEEVIEFLEEKMKEQEEEFSEKF